MALRFRAHHQDTRAEFNLAALTVQMAARLSRRDSAFGIGALQATSLTSRCKQPVDMRMSCRYAALTSWCTRPHPASWGSRAGRALM
jgi:hypothetical protein